MNCPSHQRNSLARGKVLLVGAGPGDPDLLTVKAWKAIAEADLILYDNLVSDAIRALFPVGIPAFYVGKKKGAHSIAQKDLNRLLMRKAAQGKLVCRLKGGDPFVFGRGGEEMLALRRAQIEVEVIPGLTSASACTSSAGIPLTHRGLAQGCTFVTAQGESELKLDWRALAELRHTLVFYMGVSRAGWVARQLIAAGLPVNTPAAIIENGCRDNQRTVIGTLEALESLVKEYRLGSPALLVIGQTVSLAAELASQPSASQTDILSFISEAARLTA